MLKAIRRLLNPKRYIRFIQYFWYHKVLFRITNTKFDISYCVFCESFLDDQYGIRRFLTEIGPAKNIFFLDIGRNHGFVFYYTMYRIMKADLPVSTIYYCGIDPSPLKFVYFNFHDYLSKRNIKIHYYLINRAIVFDEQPTVSLKYGEQNFGNFNVSGSNYAKKLSGVQDQFEYVDITVDTIRLPEIKDIIRRNIDSDAVITKIDCKNRTDEIFVQILDMLLDSTTKYLISCERDGSSDRDVSAYARSEARILSASDIRSQQ